MTLAVHFLLRCRTSDSVRRCTDSRLRRLRRTPRPAALHLGFGQRHARQFLSRPAPRPSRQSREHRDRRSRLAQEVPTMHVTCARAAPVQRALAGSTGDRIGRRATPPSSACSHRSVKGSGRPCAPNCRRCGLGPDLYSRLAAVGARARVRWREWCGHKQFRFTFTPKLVATLVATPFV